MTDPMDPVSPGFLLLAGHDRPVGWRRAAELAITAAGSTLLASVDAGQVEGLEAGSIPRSVVLSLWPSTEAAAATWNSIALPEFEGLLALAGACAPDHGNADFPGRAAAAAIAAPGPPAYMLIEGVVTAPEPIDRYRAIIFPMISAGGGYYLVYAHSKAVRLLAGDWSQQALIISRWPNIAAARNFWFSDRYQNEAIPCRAGAGQFSVLLFAGLPGSP